MSSSPSPARSGGTHLSPRWLSWLKLVACIGLLAAVAGIGGRVTAPEIPGWYAGLAKPSFTPPNAVFPIAWTTLYALMAFSLWRLWRAPATPARRTAIRLFLAQLALNFVWSPVFFGLHAVGAALAIVIALAAVLALAIRAAVRVDALAGWALLPYMAWICFAAALNAAIVMLN